MAGYEGVGLFPLGKTKSEKTAQLLPMKYSEGLEKPENEVIFVTGECQSSGFLFAYSLHESCIKRTVFSRIIYFIFLRL